MFNLEKQLLRKKLRIQRKSLMDKENREEKILAHMEKFLLLHKNFQHIGLYEPMGSEASILKICDIFPHKNYYFPQIEGKQMRFVPSCSQSLDVVFTPLIGFTEKGARLGQGGGFFDRYIQQLREIKAPTLWIGIAFECQKQEKLPLEDHDEYLDGIITEFDFYGML